MLNGYAEIIKTAIIFFPFIALLISFPIMLIQYHKYGSLSLFKGLIIYSLTLYLMCAFFLVILPLPSIEYVKLLKSPTMQLIPFKFFYDFFTNINYSSIITIVKTFKTSYFYVPIFNIIITIPFGVYLRYYFKCDIKKTLLYSFLLSLFFELTQLSGLYFIYPRGYRLFDIDDLILNTFGGYMGYIISEPLLKLLPRLEKIDLEAKKRGKNISGIRRTTTLFLDLFLITFIEGIISIFIKLDHIFEIVLVIYYFIIPMFLKCSTLGQKFLNIQVLDYKNKKNIFRLFYRITIFMVLYIGIPFTIYFILNNIIKDNSIKEFVAVICFGIIFIIDAITAIKYVFTNKQMLYERISKTKLVSTIK